MIDENKWGVHAATVMTSLLVEGGATRSILNLNSFHSHEIYRRHADIVSNELMLQRRHAAYRFE